MEECLYRIVELQLGDSYSRKATSSTEDSKVLDELLENNKPTIDKGIFDKLIYTSFRYELPVPEIYSARFRPASFHYNVWYGAYEKETAIYEASFHFLRERIHLATTTMKVESRTLVAAHCNVQNFLDISNHKDIKKIMDRNSYIQSHIIAHEAVKKDKDGVIYPSCRDPKKLKCAAVYKIETFSSDINKLSELTLNLNYKNKIVEWTRYPNINLEVSWDQVS